jgi:hypothetical protein
MKHGAAYLRLQRLALRLILLGRENWRSPLGKSHMQLTVEEGIRPRYVRECRLPRNSAQLSVQK